MNPENKNVYLKPVDFIDSNFRVNFKLEKNYKLIIKF